MRGIEIVLSNIFDSHDRDVTTASAIVTSANNASETVSATMIVTVIVKVISTVTISLTRDDKKSTSKCSCS